MITRTSTVFVAGHRGMVGSAILRSLREKGFNNIITQTRAELDLKSQAAVRTFFDVQKIDAVFLAAARVGGILANSNYPAEFIYDNLIIQSNIIHSAYISGVKSLLFLGSSCIYPRLAPQPIQEAHLLTDVLEKTNEPYAVAKIAGIKMCEAYSRQYGVAYRAVMPTNLYGPGDNYHLENSHVIPAMIRKFHLAKLALAGDLAAIVEDERRYGKIPEDVCSAIGLVEDRSALDRGKEVSVILWGSGAPKREFLHVDDMAEACIHVLKLKQDYFIGDSPSFLNVGTGVDLTIRETARIIAELVGFKGKVIFDSDKPDGTPRKLLDISRISDTGWRPRISFYDGLRNAYKSYLTGQKRN